MSSPEPEVVSFQIERLKFIYSQISDLNQNVHRYISLFHTLTTAILGAGVSIFLGWKKLDLEPKLAQTAIMGLLHLLVLVAAFSIFSLIVAIISWFDFRKEETKLINEISKKQSRSEPQLMNFWRWNESYHVFFIMLVVFVVCYYVNSYIIPWIK